MFWQNHSFNKPNKDEYFSKEFKHLLTFMLQLDPVHRLSISEVKNHPWVANPDVPSYEEVTKEFQKRKAILDEEARIQAIQKQQLNHVNPLKQKYKDIDINRSTDLFQEQSVNLEKKRLECISGLASNNVLFSDQNPAILYQALLNVLEKEGMTVEETSKDLYKINIECYGADGNKLTLGCSFLKTENDLTCIEFKKKLGDKVEFYEQYKKIRKALQFLSQPQASQ